MLYEAVRHNHTGNEYDLSKCDDIQEYEQGTCTDEANSIHVIHEYGSDIDSCEDITHDYEWENDCQENDSQENSSQVNNSQEQGQNDWRQVPAKHAVTAPEGMA